MTPARALRAHLRVTHPFPSLLDGLVAGGAALAAGGAGETAIRLGVSMVLLQASVGTLNDLIDAPHDADHKPGKPIPAGLVRPSIARPMVAATGVAGVVLAGPSGATTVALAVVLLALGYAYDVWFKGTAWSWLPFAVAIPLFPTYGWLGAAGGLPPIWGLLLPTAVVAGAALALGNAAVDVERDRAAGVGSVATRIGHHRAATLGVVLTAGVAATALLTLQVLGAAASVWPGIALAGSIVGIGGAVAVLHRRPSVRERGWTLQGVGLATLAGAWLGAVADAGLT